MPYLPIDPKDLGRTYEAVIRVNSQSGKGGVAYIMKTEHQLDLPRRLQIEFSGVVQQVTDDEGGEVEPGQMWDIFATHYLVEHQPQPAVTLGAYTTRSSEGKVEIEVEVGHGGERRTLHAVGNGPIDAYVNALRVARRARPGAGLPRARAVLRRGRPAAAYVECEVDGRTVWGVGPGPEHRHRLDEGDHLGGQPHPLTRPSPPARHLPGAAAILTRSRPRCLYRGD